MAHETALAEGSRLEDGVVRLLTLEGYIDAEEHITRKALLDLIKSKYLFSQRLAWVTEKTKNAPFFLQRTKIAGESIYEVPWNVDIFAWHPLNFPSGLVMEIKQQSVAGSVDEKFPFVVGSLVKIAREMGGKAVLYVSGGACRDCAKDWCYTRETVEDGVFMFVETENELRTILRKGRKKVVAPGDRL